MSTELAQLRAENERLRRQCAEARQCLDVASKLCGALRNFSSNHDQWSLCTRLMMDIDDALANDAGKDFVPIAQHQAMEKVAREMAEALWSLMKAYGHPFTGENGNSGECWDLARAATIKARALGLLEKGGAK